MSPIRRVAKTVMSMDLRLLLSILGLALCLWCFLELADEVRDGDTHPLDVQLLTAMRRADDPQRLIGPPWMEQAAIDISALGGYVVLSMVTFTVVGYLLLGSDYRSALVVFIAAVGGLLISYGLKAFFDRPRPDVVPHLLELSSKSFPSGHAQMSMVVYVTLGAVGARLVNGTRRKCYLLSLAALLALLVGISRVMLGVHYPTDVIAGWAVGLMWALVCWLAARSLQRHHVLADPNVDATT